MSEDDGDSGSSTSRMAGTGEHKCAPPVLYESGEQNTAEAGDTTPTQSRSPLRADTITEKSVSYSGSTTGTSESRIAVANGFDASDASVDRSEPNNFVHPLYAHPPPDRGHTSLGLSNVYDPLLSPSPSSPLPSRSLTPKFRSAAPPASDGNVDEDMPNSSPHSGPSSGSSRPSSRRQAQPQQLQQVHHQQQRGLQPYGFYASPSASESGLPRNTPSVSSQSGPPPFAHGQQAAAPQRSTSFNVPYAMSPSPASLYPQHQPQHQYTYPQINIHGMPSMAHSPAHPSPDFYSVGHSMSPSQPPLYAPSFHTSVPPEHTPTPTLTFDYDGGNSGRSPAPSASSPYSPQQSFAPFNYHPTLTATPQFSHSPFSSSLSTHQAQHAQRPQYPPPFAYMTGASPTTSDDSGGQQPSARWWYIPPHSASPTAGSYPNVYYLDAYGNPSNARGMGLGPGFPSLSSPSSGSVQPAAFPLPDSAVGVGPGPGPGTGRGGITAGIQRPSEGDSKPGSSASLPGAPLSPSSGAVGESVSERGQQQPPKQPKRKSILPNPPVQRSEWVMWVGNVPSDATHDELWRFFTRSSSPSGSSAVEMRSPFGQQLSQPPHLPAGLLSPSGSSSASDTNPADSSGVASVFLIARSNCAFVNYTSAAYLSSAVRRFNGIPLRPGDARCPRLVCRVRGKEEDLKAGVGGQRGTGIHTRWVREQREREWGREQDKQAGRKEVAMSDGDASASEPPGTPSSSVVHTESGAESSGQDAHAVRRPPHHSSSSGSTTSGFLARYFPKRYFILKSLTQFDLDLSVEKGVWATQPHNEAILNQAFRNSSDVYLIFGVNKSGEFFGYARMASTIGKTADDRVSWASRSDSQHSHSPTTSLASSVAGKGSQVNETIPEESEGSSPEGNDGGNTRRKEQAADEEKRSYLLFSPSEHRLAEDSPKPVTPATQKRLSNAEESSSSKIPLSGEANTAPPFDRHQEKFAESVPQNRTRQSLHLATPPISAPAVMGRSYGDIATPQVKGLGSETLDPRLLRRRLPSVQLDPEAPLRAVREHEAHSASVENPLIRMEDEDRVKRRDTLGTSVSASGSGSKLREVLQAEEVQEEINQETEADTDAGKDKQAGTNAPDDRADIPPQWGSPFKVQWIRVARLPFHRTRHLRNPWNHDREVKVSRDGTELEPLVGQALLDEWDKEEPAHAPPTPVTGGGGGGGTSLSAMNRRTDQFRTMQPQVSASTAESEAGPGPGPSRVYQPKQSPR